MVETYRRRFPEFETMCELAEYGISFDRPEYDQEGKFLGYIANGDKHLVVKHWNEATRIQRRLDGQGLPLSRLREVWEADQAERGYNPSDKRWLNFTRVYAKYLSVRQLRHNDLAAEYGEQHGYFKDGYHCD
jgi:hypothetical protein